MSLPTTPLQQSDPHLFRFYRDVLAELTRAGVAFLVGGAYALSEYTGIVRHTKDFDVFTRPPDAPRILDILGQAGYHTEMAFSHWLAKVFSGDAFVDVIFSSGNGLCSVDDVWFARAPAGRVLDMDVRLIPVEEMIWQKSFIMERERFDGADVNHLVRARGASLDWHHLLARFGPHWRVLLAHLILFGFVYPTEQAEIPAWLLEDLTERLRHDQSAGQTQKVCWGSLLSREQYLIDTEVWGYRDPRLPPCGRMTPEQINHWTAAIEH
jgi:hypothetical protein